MVTNSKDFVEIKELHFGHKDAEVECQYCGLYQKSTWRVGCIRCGDTRLVKLKKINSYPKGWPESTPGYVKPVVGDDFSWSTL